MNTHNPHFPHCPTWAVVLLMLLFAWCFTSCKTTRQTFSSESERNATSATHCRSALNLSSDSLWRLTALSFDSCKITFAMSGKTDTIEDAQSSYPSGKPKTSKKAKPSKSTTAKPSASKATPSILPTAKPSSLTIYGLHLSQEEKKKSLEQSNVEDSNATAKQSSSDKSKQQEKVQTPFIPIKLIALITLIMAIAIIIHFRRRSSGK